MDNKDLSMMAALAKSIGGGGSSGPTIPTPTSGDSGKVIKVDDEGAYGLALDEGQSTFAGLTDVALTDPTDGQVPVYDGTTNKWKNGSVGGGDSTVIIDCYYSSGIKLPNDISPKDIADLISNGKNVVLRYDNKRYEYNMEKNGYITATLIALVFCCIEITGNYTSNIKNTTFSVDVLALPDKMVTTKGVKLTPISFPKLPRVTGDDNGKILKVVNGGWAAVTPE